MELLILSKLSLKILKKARFNCRVIFFAMLLDCPKG